MTAPKRQVTTLRPPSYVCRDTGAAELEISPATWDAWVKEGRLPAAAPGFPETAPRWRWADVDQKLAGKTADTVDSAMAGLANLKHGPKADAH
jgi:hypothetical protein